MPSVEPIRDEIMIKVELKKKENRLRFIDYLIYTPYMIYVLAVAVYVVVWWLIKGE